MSSSLSLNIADCSVVFIEDFCLYYRYSSNIKTIKNAALIASIVGTVILGIGLLNFGMRWNLSSAIAMSVLGVLTIGISLPFTRCVRQWRMSKELINDKTKRACLSALKESEMTEPYKGSAHKGYFKVLTDKKDKGLHHVLIRKNNGDVEIKIFKFLYAQTTHSVYMDSKPLDRYIGQLSVDYLQRYI